MPKSQVGKGKMFREFSKQPERYINNNYAKYIKDAFRIMTDKYEIARAEMEFMLFVYDLEFFTLDWVADEMSLSRKKLAPRVVYPLLKRGYLYKNFDKLSPKTELDQMFHENKYNYRVRYALSQKGRLNVQRFYRKLESPNSII